MTASRYGPVDLCNFKNLLLCCLQCLFLEIVQFDLKHFLMIIVNLI